MNSEYQYLLNSMPNSSTYGGANDPSQNGGFNYFNPSSSNIPNLMNSSYQFGQYNSPGQYPGFGGNFNNQQSNHLSNHQGNLQGNLQGNYQGNHPVTPTFSNNFLNDFSNPQSQGPNIIKRSKKDFFEGSMKVINKSPIINSIAPKINSNKPKQSSTPAPAPENNSVNKESMKNLIAQIRNVINS